MSCDDSESALVLKAIAGDRASLSQLLLIHYDRLRRRISRRISSDLQGLLRPDGKPLAINMEFWARDTALSRTCELVRDYWQKAGMQVVIKPIDRALYGQRTNANELDLGVWAIDRCSELRAYIPWTSKFFDLASELGQGVAWQLWYESNGEAGEEPPSHIKDMYRKLEAWTTTTSEAEYRRLAQELFDFQAENLFLIGTVGIAPAPIIVKNQLRNVPGDGTYYGADGSFNNMLRGSQWYLEE